MHDQRATLGWPPTVPAAPPHALEWSEPPDDLEIVAEGLAFPEGPIACRDGSVLVVEVRGGNLTRVLPTGATEVVAELGGGPNGAAIGPDGAAYVPNNGGLPWTQRVDGSWYPMDPVTGSMTPAGFRGGWVQRVDLTTGTVTRIIEGFGGRSLSGPSDIAFDLVGNLWFTDIGKTSVDNTDHGAVYRSRIDGSSLGLFARGLLGPNGIAFAPRGDRLYVADSPSGRILEWDVASGHLPVDPRVHGAGVRGRLPGLLVVDGIAVDSQDRVIVALPQAGALAVVQPDGGTWLIPMPDPLPSNVCFGGEDGRTIYVTLGGHGRLARFRWPCPGAQLPYTA